MTSGQDRRARAVNSIVMASLSTLQDVGHNRFRTQEVAARSGTSEGLIFRYFPTKLALVSASLDRALSDHLQRLVAEFELLPKPSDQRSMLNMIWRLLSHDELLWTYELIAAAHTDQALRDSIRPILDAHSDAIDNVAIVAVRDIAGISETQSRMAVNVITWTMQALVLRDMGRGQRGTHVRLIESLLMISSALAPPARANPDSE